MYFCIQLQINVPELAIIIKRVTYIHFEGFNVLVFSFVDICGVIKEAKYLFLQVSYLRSLGLSELKKLCLCYIQPQLFKCRIQLQEKTKGMKYIHRTSVSSRETDKKKNPNR